MSSTLQTQSFVVSGTSGDLAGTSATVSLRYYVGLDAQIPEGQYTYSNSDAKTNFTFDAAMVSGAIDSTGYPIAPARLVDGSIVVKQVGSVYQFSFQGTLESGNTFSGHTQGTLAYSDNNIY
jgi:hypothetical protein